MTTIKDRLVNLVSSLDENDNFSVESAGIGDPATKDEIEAARKAANSHLPPGVEEFYSAVGSFELKWRYIGRAPRLPTKQGNQRPELKQYLSQIFKKDARVGMINILPITEVFSSWADSIWFPTSTDKERGYDGFGLEDGDGESWLYQYRHVKPFDHFTPEACLAFLLRWEEGGDCGKPLDQVAYHYCGESLEQRDWTFGEYLERMLISRDFWIWHDLSYFGDREALEIVASVLFKEHDSDPEYKD